MIQEWSGRVFWYAAWRHYANGLLPFVVDSYDGVSLCAELSIASNQAQPLLIWWRRDPVVTISTRVGLGSRLSSAAQSHTGHGDPFNAPYVKGFLSHLRLCRDLFREDPVDIVWHNSCLLSRSQRVDQMYETGELTERPAGQVWKSRWSYPQLYFCLAPNVLHSSTNHCTTCRTTHLWSTWPGVWVCQLRAFRNTCLALSDISKPTQKKKPRTRSIYQHFFPRLCTFGSNPNRK